MAIVRGPLWFGALLLLANLTVVNALSLVGNFSRPPTFEPASDADGARLGVAFEHSRKLWPWGGTIGVALHVLPGAAAFDGLVRGAIVFEVRAAGAAAHRRSPCHVGRARRPLTVRIVPPAPRRRRLLFDALPTSLRYPPASPLAARQPRSDRGDARLDGRPPAHQLPRPLRLFAAERVLRPDARLPVPLRERIAVGRARPRRHRGAVHGGGARKLAHDVHVGRPRRRRLRRVVLGRRASSAALLRREHARHVDAAHRRRQPARAQRAARAVGHRLWRRRAHGPARRRRRRHASRRASPPARRSTGGPPAATWRARRTSTTKARSSPPPVPPHLQPASLGARLRRDVAVVGLLQPRAPTAGRLAAFVDTECLDSTWRLQQPKMEAAAGQACWWLLRLLLDFALDGARDDALLSGHGDTAAAEPLSPRVVVGAAAPFPPAADDAGALAARPRRPRPPRRAPRRVPAVAPRRLDAAPPPRLQPPREGLLPLETFGALAHWPYAARGRGRTARRRRPRRRGRWWARRRPLFWLRSAAWCCSSAGGGAGNGGGRRVRGTRSRNS